MGAILEVVLGLKISLKRGPKMGPVCGTHSLPSGVWESPEQKIDERDERGKAAGSIFSKRKRGIYNGGLQGDSQGFPGWATKNK